MYNCVYRISEEEVYFHVSIANPTCGSIHVASLYLVGYHNFRLVHYSENSHNMYFFFSGAYSLPNFPTKSSATSGKYLVIYQQQGSEYWNGSILKG